MRWVEKILDKLDEAIELQSPGSISWKFDDVENCLLLAPSLVKLVGGANDGESVFPFYSLSVSQFIEVFDETPAMHWNTMHNEFSVEGKIGSQDAWIIFSKESFE